MGPGVVDVAGSYKLGPEALSDATRRWVWRASQLGTRDRTVRPGDPPASFNAMLCAATLLDDGDARWLASQLGASLTAELVARYDATAVLDEREPPADVLPLITRSTESWLHAAALVAFGHRPDAKATPMEVVAAFVDRRGPGHQADYAKLPLGQRELAAAFLEHVRTAHPELRFVFELLVSGRERVPIDELEPIVSRFAADAYQCFKAARADADEPSELPAILVASLGQRLDIDLAGTPTRSPGTSHTPPLTEIPLESAAWFQSARALAATAGSDRVDVHHLVAVALRRGRNGDPLLTAAVNPSAIPAAITQLVERVGATRSDEAQAIWDYFAPAAPVPPAAPGYRSDTAEGSDRLNFEAEARAVALLAVSPAAPPLSVGVFGEWGTGKSFFMRSVQRHAAADDVLQDVLQIEFNAWHYAEGNLFASLAHRVFTALRDRMGGQTTNPLDDALPATLRSETARIAARQAAERRGQAEANLKARQTAVDQRRAAPGELGEAILDSAVEATLAPPTDDPQKATAEARAKVEAAKVMLRAQVGEGWQLARSQLLRARVLVPFFALVLVVAALLIEVPALQAWYIRISGLALAVASGAAAAGKYLMAAWHHARTLHAHIRSLDRAMTESKRRNDPEFQRLATELSTALVAETDAAQRAAAADRELAGLIERVRSTAPMARLDALVRDRFESGTYKKMLGIVEQVRADLETLSLLLVPDQDAQRRREMLAKHQIPESALPKLRRIILYIDDLDRCPADKVVEVLQAVHLLLAFPLFVVFVAVDPRWGIASLERSFEQLAPSPSGSITSATGFDYLEKIFQIPLWVRTMSGGDAARLLGDYLPTGVKPLGTPTGANGSSPAAPSHAAARSAATNGTATHGNPTAALAVAVEATAANARPATVGPTRQPPSNGLDRIQVSLDEFNYAEALAASLGPSPRRVKRFANLYQLVKAMLSGPEWYGFDLEDARACLTLLALQTGAPSVAPEVLDDLITGAHIEAAMAAHLGLPALYVPRSPRGEPGDLARAKQILEIYFEHTTIEHARSRLALWAPRISRLAFRRDAVPLGPRPVVPPPHAQLP